MKKNFRNVLSNRANLMTQAALMLVAAPVVHASVVPTQKLEQRSPGLSSASFEQSVLQLPRTCKACSFVTAAANLQNEKISVAVLDIHAELEVL